MSVAILRQGDLPHRLDPVGPVRHRGRRAARRARRARRAATAPRDRHRRRGARRHRLLRRTGAARDRPDREAARRRDRHRRHPARRRDRDGAVPPEPRSRSARRSTWTRRSSCSIDLARGDARMDGEVRVPITTDADLVTARAEARAMAERLGFPRPDPTLIATAISEIARNIVVHVGHGEIVLQALRGRRPLRPRRDRDRRGRGHPRRRGGAAGRLQRHGAASASACRAPGG